MSASFHYSQSALLSGRPAVPLHYLPYLVYIIQAGSRPVHDIQQQCLKAEVPFFFKQWGGRNKKKTGRILNGQTYNEMPQIIGDK